VVRDAVHADGEGVRVEEIDCFQLCLPVVGERPGRPCGALPRLDQAASQGATRLPHLGGREALEPLPDRGRPAVATPLLAEVAVDRLL